MNRIRKTGIGALLVAGALTGGALGANFVGSAGAATSATTAASGGRRHRRPRARARPPRHPTRAREVTWPTGSPRRC